MSRPTLKRPVGDVLTTISALRRLCLGLPHAPTPAEMRQLERFERLRQAEASPGDEDIGALRAGLRHCWRSRDVGTLQQMTARLPSALLERDRWLQSFAVAARSVVATQEGSKGTARG